MAYRHIPCVILLHIQMIIGYDKTELNAQLSPSKSQLYKLYQFTLKQLLLYIYILYYQSYGI